MYWDFFKIFKFQILFVIVMSVIYYLNTDSLRTTQMEFFAFMKEENNRVIRTFLKDSLMSNMVKSNKNIELVNIKEELLYHVYNDN